MLTRIFWVPEAEPYRLAFMPRPQGGEQLSDELMGWRVAGLDTVVSLLEPSEAAYLDLNEEREFCESVKIEFLSFPIGDRGLPSHVEEVQSFVSGLVSRLQNGKSIGIHCRMGIGRSSLITACVLIHLGVSYHDVFPALSAARGLDVPDTQAQMRWVYDYARLLAPINRPQG